MFRSLELMQPNKITMMHSYKIDLSEIDVFNYCNYLKRKLNAELYMKVYS